jgi:hypothetical protein
MIECSSERATLQAMWVAVSAAHIVVASQRRERRSGLEIRRRRRSVAAYRSGRLSFSRAGIAARDRAGHGPADSGMLSQMRRGRRSRCRAADHKVHVVWDELVREYRRAPWRRGAGRSGRPGEREARRAETERQAEARKAEMEREERARLAEWRRQDELALQLAVQEERRANGADGSWSSCSLRCRLARSWRSISPSKATHGKVSVRRRLAPHGRNASKVPLVSYSSRVTFEMVPSTKV